MTPLTKPISRRGCTPCYGRTLAVTLYPGDVIGVRQSGTRTEYTLPPSILVGPVTEAA